MCDTISTRVHPWRPVDQTPTYVCFLCTFGFCTQTHTTLTEYCCYRCCSQVNSWQKYSPWSQVWLQWLWRASILQEKIKRSTYTHELLFRATRLPTSNGGPCGGSSPRLWRSGPPDIRSVFIFINRNHTRAGGRSQLKRDVAKVVHFVQRRVLLIYTAA